MKEEKIEETGRNEGRRKEEMFYLKYNKFY